MAQESSDVIVNEDLEEWTKISSGGFGSVYKAEHRALGVDVAIKLLHPNSGLNEKEELHKEADNMKKLSFEYVVRIYGIYDGIPPFQGQSRCEGIVMQYMSGGTIESLQRALSGPPPLPLAVRLAHQVALGMNFLHSRGIVHHDIKPSNVLLTGELNAKLSDFGLSRGTTSVLNNTGSTSGQTGGTFKYMPPEAFKEPYKPVRSFDIYSYGILLWSIFTGQEPYKGKDINLVVYHVKNGDRPEVEVFQKQVGGMEELVTLIKQCWAGDSQTRPKSEDIKKVTQVVFSKHKSKVNAAVSEVLSKLGSSDSPMDTQQSQTGGAVSAAHTPENALSEDLVHHPEQPVQARAPPSSPEVKDVFPPEQIVGPSQVQYRDTQPPKVDPPKTSDGDHINKRKAEFVDDKKPELVQRTSNVMPIVDTLGKKVHQEAYSLIFAERTRQDKMRVLYEMVLEAGGELVKAAFYDALKKHEKFLMEDLGG